MDVDGAVLRMRMPLNELRAKLQALRENVASALKALEEGLERRAEAAEVRSTVEVLLVTSHVLSKVPFKLFPPTSHLDVSPYTESPALVDGRWRSCWWSCTVCPSRSQVERQTEGQWRRRAADSWSG